MDFYSLLQQLGQSAGNNIDETGDMIKQARMNALDRLKQSNPNYIGPASPPDDTMANYALGQATMGSLGNAGNGAKAAKGLMPKLKAIVGDGTPQELVNAVGEVNVSPELKSVATDANSRAIDFAKRFQDQLRKRKGY